MIILLVFVIQSVLSAPFADDLIISLPDGQIQGTTYITTNNITYYGFQGIPYATPPVGSLRFEAPKPPQPWTGVWDATQDSKSCISNQPSESESEDCLYINVYTTSLKPAEKRPVFLWVYGGKFIRGNSSKLLYGPDFLVEEDVVFVSFNYRVGPYGFLSTGDATIPGNAGLKDQSLAMKWAHDNIAYFGGDPDKITIFGQSAGGASTGLHLISKKSAGLFRAAGVQSGAALTYWAIDENPKSYADLLANALSGGSYVNDTQQLKKFLQEKTTEEISQAASYLMSLYEDNQAWPVVEVENGDAFLTESPYQLVESGRFSQVPILIGICANEAIMLLGSLENAERVALSYDTVPSTIIPKDLRENATDEDVVIQSIKNMYLDEEDTFSSNLAAMSNYYSDNLFTRGVIKQAELSSRYVPVYLYQFAYYGRTRVSFFIDGAEKTGHAGEIPFLFNDTKIHDANSTNPANMLTQNRMVKLWTNFAKYLNPTPEKSELIDVIWPVVSPTELHYLNINSTLDVQSPLRETFPEWNGVYETYGKKPYITF